MTKNLVLISLILFFIKLSYSQKQTDANVFGHVESEGEHLSYISIIVKGTTIGTFTDATGHYLLVNLPEGTHTIKARGVGYKTQEKTITIKADQTIELNFDLEIDMLYLDRVVVTASRVETDRSDAPVIVNIVNSRQLDAVNAQSLSEGLSFTPGLRLENNCQNCGFTQLRMNGLDGAYSQILINSRPVFGALASVYGLEQIPADMIDRVEVVRGGGSALFGGSAIAGTVNIITKDPITNSFQAGTSLSLINGEALDASVNYNASITTDDRKSGMYIFGIHRNRDNWDANDDGFSEITELNGNTIGFKGFHRPSKRSRVTIDFSSINEFRRGGNKFNLLPHQSDLTEQIEHKIHTGGATYETFLHNYSQKLSFYISGQQIMRDSYYGAEQDPDAYGYTEQNTVLGGVQFNSDFERFLFTRSTFTTGIEMTSDNLIDQKFSVISSDRTTIADQDIFNIALYAQNQWDFSPVLILLGFRADNHSLLDKPVFSPRGNILYSVSPNSRLRLSYARGFRAPQLFDEDLHVELAGAQAIRRENAPDLSEEISNSISGSIDYSGRISNIDSYFLLEGFYTSLNNPFITHLEIDDQGLAYFLKSNGKGAQVYGSNAEIQIAPSRKLQIQLGFTLQKAIYVENEVVWEPESLNPDSTVTTSSLLRTPGNYGYFLATYNPINRMEISLTGTYSGRMKTPHMIDHVTTYTVVKETPTFLDLGTKIAYNLSITREFSVQIYAGIRNILNSYQKDFDKGLHRDAGYIYGPAFPRTFYFGIKTGIF